jgi:ribonuclease P protein component
LRQGEIEAQVKRRFRLTRSTDIKRVRRSGKSYAHPLVVLYVAPADGAGTRVGVSAGLTIGNAVKRNRAKRLLRAAMNALLPDLVPGFDLLLVARPPLSGSDSHQIRQALSVLLARAGLLILSHDG